MLDRVRFYIDTHGLISSADSVLIGVSGGIDSMVLLHVMQALGYRVSCAHVNYRMRGEASEGDREMVESYCRSRKIACFVHCVDDAFLEDGKAGSFQEKARSERYEFFRSMAVEQAIAYVAVAHHLDDQAETVLMHLMRGSGVEGLAGMPPTRLLAEGEGVKLIRPLLGVTRASIRAYAEEEKIPWREDVSNEDPKYRRNAVRHEVLADVRRLFGSGAAKNIARSAEYLRGYLEASLQPELAERFAGIAMPDRGLDVEKLKAAPRVWQDRIVLEALHRWLPEVEAGSRHATVICDLLDAQVGRRVEIGDASVWRERSALRFVPGGASRDASTAATYIVNPGDRVSFDAGVLALDFVEPASLSELTCPPDVLLADAGKVQFPLVLRLWQPGDRFAPFGMEGRKKVSDFLTDVKIPPHQRTGVWVLESDGEIIWVVGFRAGDTVRVDGDTLRVLRCKLQRR